MGKACLCTLFSHWLVSVQWLEKRIDRISVFLNLLSELICGLAYDVSWRLLLVHLKIMYILPLWDRNIGISSNAQIGLKTNVSGLTLCPSIDVSSALKSLPDTMLMCLPFYLLNFALWIEVLLCWVHIQLLHLFELILV